MYICIALLQYELLLELAEKLPQMLMGGQSQNKFEKEPVNVCRLALSLPLPHYLFKREIRFRRIQCAVPVSVDDGDLPVSARLVFVSSVLPAAQHAGADEGRAEHLQCSFP